MRSLLDAEEAFVTTVTAAVTTAAEAEFGTFRSGGSGSSSMGEGHEVSPDAGRKIESSVR
jgi:hypothetical protein